MDLTPYHAKYIAPELTRRCVSEKQSVASFRKVLLTATSLQNSLFELCGLVGIIDDLAFGDLKTYASRFARLDNDDDFMELKDRLLPICKRMQTPIM